MEAPINFEDFHQQLAFGFFDSKTRSFQPLDPRIGRFQLTNDTIRLGSATDEIWKSTNVDIVEIPEADSNVMAKVHKSFGSKADLKGLYTVRNASMLELQGSRNDITASFVTLSFSVCDRSKKGANCASEEDIKAYLASNSLYIASPDNFIDMENVQLEDETLQSANNIMYYSYLDYDRP